MLVKELVDWWDGTVTELGSALGFTSPRGIFTHIKKGHNVPKVWFEVLEKYFEEKSKRCLEKAQMMQEGWIDD